MKKETIISRMNLVVRNLEPSGYKMGDKFTLTVIHNGETITVTHDTRQYYQGRRAKTFNASIRHGIINKTMSVTQLNKAFAPLEATRLEQVKREKQYAAKVAFDNTPEGITIAVKKEINIVGVPRCINYGYESVEQFMAESNYDHKEFHCSADDGYRGCGVYRLAIRDGKITATVYGGFHNSRPAHIKPDLWMPAIIAELQKHGTIVKADGSGCQFFLRDTEDAALIEVKEYVVPAPYGNGNMGFAHLNTQIL